MSDQRSNMNMHWRVLKVIAVEGRTTAELARVEWFKANPAYVERMERYDAWLEEVGQEEADLRSAQEPDADVWYDETIEANPGEEGAKHFAPGVDNLTLDITEGPDLMPGDNVVMTLDVLA